MDSGPPTEPKNKPVKPWGRFAAASLIAAAVAWFFGFLPPAFYFSVLGVTWLVLLYWVLVAFSASRARPVANNLLHNFAVGIALCIAMAITCWVPVALTLGLRHDRQLPEAATLAPNNSSKPTPLRGAA